LVNIPRDDVQVSESKVKVLIFMLPCQSYVPIGTYGNSYAADMSEICA